MGDPPHGPALRAPSYGLPITSFDAGSKGSLKVPYHRSRISGRKERLKLKHRNDHGGAREGSVEGRSAHPHRGTGISQRCKPAP